MNATATAAHDVPILVGEISGEVQPGDGDVWQPNSFAEWQAAERTKTYLNAWSEQLAHERDLRSYWARMLFKLIAWQVAGTFVLVIGQGLGCFEFGQGVLQVLIPSVFGEVFGMGFIVVKYLFSQPLRHSLDALMIRSNHGS